MTWSFLVSRQCLFVISKLNRSKLGDRKLNSRLYSSLERNISVNSVISNRANPIDDIPRIDQFYLPHLHQISGICQSWCFYNQIHPRLPIWNNNTSIKRKYFSTNSGRTDIPVVHDATIGTRKKPDNEQSTKKSDSKNTIFKEKITTIPNFLTVGRMVSAPVIGVLVGNGMFDWALGVFVVAGLTDVMDGYIARNFENQKSVLGTALDPLADKVLVTWLYIILTGAGLIPFSLTALIIGRDALLVAAAFYIRYISLPQPKTVARYFDITLPTAKLYPTTISKINTVLQLSLVALSLSAPVFNFVDHPYLQACWYLTAATTFASGLGYAVNGRASVKILDKKDI